MGLESASFISELVDTNPVGAVDDYATADDHLRLIKSVLQGQFPNFTAAAANASIAEMNRLVGLTGPINDASSLSAGVLADARVQASNVTQHVGAIDHNGLLNWVLGEHVVWGTAGAGLIHRDHLPPADETNIGCNEVATLTEAITGSDTARMITPATLHNVVFSGSILTGGGANRLPSGWTVAHPGTGRYVVTHGLGLTTPDEDLIVVANIWGVTGVQDVVVANINTNDFEIRASNSGTMGDAPTGFIAHRTA